jgi:hemerythrin
MAWKKGDATMPLLTWNDSYNLKIRELDEQHKKLVNILNQLHEAMGKGQSRDVLKPLLAELVRYTETHFKNEEAYMTRFAYPEFAAHKALHDELTKKALDLKIRYDGGQTMLSVETLNFLKNWLITHIQGEDKKYSSCFAEHGLT